MKARKIIICITAFSIFFSTSFSAAFATTTITSNVTTVQDLDENDEELEINGPNGNLDVTDSVAVDAAFGATGLRINVSTSSDKGIRGSGNNAAIIARGGLLQELLLYSGVITGDIGLDTDPDNNRGTVTLMDSNSVMGIEDDPASTFILLGANGSIENTSTSPNGGVAIFYKNTVGNTILNIENSGEILRRNNANSVGIYFEDTSGSTLTFTNNADGRISYIEEIDDAGLGKAIEIIGNNNATITNNGFIQGSITASTGQTTITNSGANSIIFGNINLGSNSASSLTIGHNSARVEGNLTFGNASQNLLVTNGYFSGGIIGNGIVRVGSSGTIKLNSVDATAANPDFTASIDGYRSGAPDDTPVGSIEINAGQDVTAGANIGATQAINNITLKTNSTLRLNQGTARSINAASLGDDVSLGSVNLESGSKLYVGNAAVNAAINSTAAGNGDVYFTDNNTLYGNLSADSSLNSVNLSTGVTISTNSKTISAATTTLNDNASLLGRMSLNGNIILGNNAEIIANSMSRIGNSSSHIDGNSDGHGYVKINDGTSTVYANIGQSHRIEEFEVATGATAYLFNSIAADYLTVDGRLNLGGTDSYTLSGSLEVGSTGDLNLGSRDQTLNGDATFNSGAILSVALGATDSGSFTVTGAATLNANTTLSLSIDSNTALSSSYTILTGGAGSSISAIDVSKIKVNGSSTNIFESYTLSASVVGNSLVINAAITPTSTPTTITRNSSQREIYNNINGIASPTGQLSSFKDYLNSSAGTAQKSAALESATPQTDNSSNRLSFNNVVTSGNLISNRLQATHSTPSSIRGISSGSSYLYNSFWVEGFGSNAKQGTTSQSSSYMAQTGGLIMGFDRKIDASLTAGFALTYANSDIKGQGNLKHTYIDSYQPSIYAGYDNKDFYINGLLGVAFNKYKTNRNISVINSTARAKYSGESYFSRIDVGTNRHITNGFILTPTLAVTAARNSIDAYQEEGAGTMNLSVKNKDTDFFEGRLGFSLSKNFSSSKRKEIIPFLSASYGYDFAGAKQRTVSNFSGQSTSFTSTGESIARGSSVIGTGLKITTSKQFSLKVNYNFEHRTEYKAHGASLTAKYRF